MAVSFDFTQLSERERYKLMIGTIIPRPIALVTTVDEHGRINAAPFSFFNCLSADPPILAIGVENNADMSFKDTGHNIRMTEVFTVNIVSFAIAEAPAAFECRRHVTLELGRSRQIVMGEIVYAHYRDGVVDPRLHVDPAAVDAIARLGGDTCATIRDRFEMLTPKL
ncbi:flavin reductase [Rhizobium leguminosarum]|uniref:Flavin reductase n=1 Tax=Rhizobium leguminosarum TaxID=384 RepID=A0A1L3Z5E0_RHILE|nr:flavin reductase family protein [Rhizobium leguminosarum]API50875.1 flavin reductase [Rhizobium leguminosarum]